MKYLMMRKVLDPILAKTYLKKKKEVNFSKCIATQN